MDVSMYERATQHARVVVAGTDRKQFGDETPCNEWDVRTLLNHLIGGCVSCVEGAAGNKVGMDDGDHTSGDFLEAYDRASSDAITAFSSPGAMEKTFTMPWGDTPGSAVLGLALADAVVHGWDLARGTGQKIQIDDDIADAIYGMTTSMMQPLGSYPRGDSFKDPLTVSDDAAPVEKMLAYLGRDPGL
jgi:uncharacterized protein (TIGR03086 family)